MATPVNAPIDIVINSVAGNSGNSYDWIVKTSINNWRTDWAAATTPIYSGLSSRNYKQVHWRVRVNDVGYATPQGPYPYWEQARAEASGTCGSVEINSGRQFFSNLVAADLTSIESLATPVI